MTNGPTSANDALQSGHYSEHFTTPVPSKVGIEMLATPCECCRVFPERQRKATNGHRARVAGFVHQPARGRVGAHPSRR